GGRRRWGRGGGDGGGGGVGGRGSRLQRGRAGDCAVHHDAAGPARSGRVSAARRERGREDEYDHGKKKTSSSAHGHTSLLAHSKVARETQPRLGVGSPITRPRDAPHDDVMRLTKAV